jgi:hypothetical protein
MSLAAPLSRRSPRYGSPSRGRDYGNLRARGQDPTLATTKSTPPSGKLRDANERRLSGLVGQGIRIVLDGPEVLQFVLGHVNENWCPRDFERKWLIHVSALLDKLDADLARESRHQDDTDERSSWSNTTPVAVPPHGRHPTVQCAKGMC